MAFSFDAVCRELDRRRRVTMGLERIETLLGLLGDPHRRVRIVQVVGTNGKGTTAVALASALSAAGHPAGTYLSPHVLSYTERVMLGGRFVSEERFAAAMAEAMAVADRFEVPASQFELLTAGAVKLFADEGLSWAVLEAGLGARYDATTAARPEAVVLTNVGLDHAEYLGETVEDVANEKLASVTPGSVLILGSQDPTVVRLANGRCSEVGARLVRAGADLDLDPEEGLPLYAVRDASLGISAAEELLGEKLDDEVRSIVLSSLVNALPARFETHRVEGVPVVVDGGHNPSGVEAALDAMDGVYGGVPLAVVFGVLRDKDAVSMLTTLSRSARTVVLTRPEGERAADPAEISAGRQEAEGEQILTAEDPVDAVRAAVRRVKGEGGAVLVIGSFATAAPVLRWLRDG